MSEGLRAGDEGQFGARRGRRGSESGPLALGRSRSETQQQQQTGGRRNAVMDPSYCLGRPRSSGGMSLSLSSTSRTRTRTRRRIRIGRRRRRLIGGSEPGRAPIWPASHLLLGPAPAPSVCRAHYNGRFTSHSRPNLVRGSPGPLAGPADHLLHSRAAGRWPGRAGVGPEPGLGDSHSGTSSGSVGANEDVEEWTPTWAFELN